MAFKSSTTLISKGTEVVGDINFIGELVVEGKVRGNIRAAKPDDGHVRIHESGLVEGQILAPTVMVDGTVIGDVNAGKHVELAAKAVVEGNVHYQLIEMVKGAQVNGSMVYSGDVTKKPKKEGDRPVPAKIGPQAQANS